MTKPVCDPVFTPPALACNFAAEEVVTLEKWRECDAFHESMRRSKAEDRPLYTFYDGPPFATGLPHFGHILAGTIKDTVTRYAHQTGHHVERRFGWDCHGLPVEYEIDKKLGITSKEQVLALGIDKYNEECRSIVQRYSSEWKIVTERIGRWIDMENDWRTMNPQFMESTWWVFKQMQKKGLVYQGFKVMPYSTACHTPLSNFEKGQNYKTVMDPAIIISFPILDAKESSPLFGASLLAFTTTPWTLPSNLALCVNARMKYDVIKDTETGAHYVIGSSRVVSQLYAKKSKRSNVAAPYTVLATVVGADLVGLHYQPIFPYFSDYLKGFVVVADDYVEEDSGTGIVHQAPAFGEDDYRVVLENGIIERGAGIICPVDESGCFTKEVTNFAGRYVKEADRDIIRLLTKNGRLIRETTISHEYPHCWRSDTPLIYKAVPSWFVNVPKIRDRLLEHNEMTYWVPAHVKEKRFHNWLKDARDWSVSRTRYWGTPLPVWISDDGEEVVFIGSIAELQERSGWKEPITDLHRHHIDQITIPSSMGKGQLKRVEDVFDCWFESGSMPYGSCHYPFENQETFQKGFPADFIAEGLDQTRGWFYTLLVCSTALFDSPPFKNLVVNGLVLAADGRKMSKKLKNYPDPMEVVTKYGADALRLYMINSPVVCGEPLRFREDGVHGVVKDVLTPWYNVFSLFITQARRLALQDGVSFKPDSSIFHRTNNVMDKWIMSSLQTLIFDVRREMGLYHLDKVLPHLLTFLDRMSRWYCRLNKNRIKGIDVSVDQCLNSLRTLYHVLLTVSRLMAPFTPFLADHLYRNLRNALPPSERQDTIHFDMIPEVDESSRNVSIEQHVLHMQTVIDLGRAAREKANISLRIPLPTCIVVTQNQELMEACTSLCSYIQTELNVRAVEFSSQVASYISLSAEPDNKALGKRLGAKRKAIADSLVRLSHDEVVNLKSSGSIHITGETISLSEVSIITSFVGDSEKFVSQSAGDAVVIISRHPDESCLVEGSARAIVSYIQSMRKEAKLKIEDAVTIYASGIHSDYYEYIENALRHKIHNISDYNEKLAVKVAEESKTVAGSEKIHVIIARPN